MKSLIYLNKFFSIIGLNLPVMLVAFAFSLASHYVETACLATAPDASTVTDTAQTAFEQVSVLVSSFVGFFIIVKIVRWIQK